MTPREEFRDYALRHLNVPYYWGGANPLQGLDCSGLTQILLDYLGIDPPGDQTADGLLRHFRDPAKGRIVTIADLGTLVFYGKPELATHVTMALDGTRMLEAGGGGRGTTSPAIAAAQGAYVKVSRITRRADRVAMIAPVGLPW